MISVLGGIEMKKCIVIKFCEVATCSFPSACPVLHILVLLALKFEKW